MKHILAVSGSPVPNSNVDRAIKTILEASERPYHFIKLSSKNVKPCRACLRCIEDNHCKQKDDYASELENLAREADIWVIGGWPPFGTVDGFTKAFCERTYSLRHVRYLTKGKKGMVVAGGTRHSAAVHHFLEHFFMSQGIELIGSLKLNGNVTCLSCGRGETCSISNVKRIWGQDATITPDKFWKFDEQADLVNKAKELGQKLKML